MPRRDVDGRDKPGHDERVLTYSLRMRKCCIAAVAGHSHCNPARAVPISLTGAPFPKFVPARGATETNFGNIRGTGKPNSLVPLIDLNFLNGLSASVQEVQIGGTSKNKAHKEC
jgi:hypothetical protein